MYCGLVKVGNNVFCLMLFRGEDLLYGSIQSRGESLILFLNGASLVNL